MKVRSLISVFAVAALLPATVCALTPNNWQAVDGSAGGSLADAAHWSAGLPTLDHYATFPGGLGSYTVTMPATFELKSNFRATAHEGETVTFDWRNCQFRQPSLTGDEKYADEPFSFRFAKGHFWNFQSYNQSKTHAVSDIGDALMRLSVAEGSPRLDFDQGAFDFLTPCDSAPWEAYTMLFANGITAHAEPYPQNASVYFHEGSSLTIGKMYLQGNAATNLLCFDGGTHTIAMNVNIPERAQVMTDRPTTTIIRVADTAQLSVGGAITFGAEHTSFGDTSARTFLLDVVDGGRLTLNDALQQASGGHLGIAVSNGSKLTASKDFKLATVAGTTAQVEIDGATFAVSPSGSVVVGKPDASPSTVSFSATNATLALDGKFTVENGAHRIVDSDVVLGAEKVFRLLAGTALDLVSSRVSASVAQTFGDGSADDGVLRFDGSDVSLDANIDFVGGRTVFDRSTVEIGGMMKVLGAPPIFSNSVVRLMGGAAFDSGTTVFGDTAVETSAERFIVANTAGAHSVVVFDGDSETTVPGALYMGHETGSCGELRLAGGNHVFKGSIYTGWNGTGVLHVAGARVDNVRGTGDAFAYMGVGSKKSFGRLVVSDGHFAAEGGYGIQVGWTGAGEMLVSGGSVSTTRIRLGSNNSAAETPVIPYDSFAQTGGRVDISQSGNEHGLAVALAANREGRVALDGGVLRSGRVYGGAGVARLTADGGTLVIPVANENAFYGFDSAELGAKGLTIESDFPVTLAQSFTSKSGADGRLVLAGAGVKTLTGEETRLSKLVVSGGTAVLPVEAEFGGITVTDGAQLAFDPAATAVSLASVTLGDAGGTGVLRLRPGQSIAIGKLSIASARIVFDGDFPSGDNGTDYPLVTVEEPLDAASTAAWKAAFVQSGLADGDTAVFSSTTADGVTTLSAHVRKAADLVFTLDQGVSNVTEDVDITANESITALVARNARLTFGGTLVGGHFVKAGEGCASLTSAGNAFASGVTVESGLLTVADPAALGLSVPNSQPELTLRGGTLAFSGPASGASLDRAVTLSAPDLTNGVIVKADVPLSMPLPSGPGAAFIKRGAEPLVLEAAGPADFPSRGHDPFAYNPKAETSVFDENGTVPDGFYGGLNVVEGELVLRSADDSQAVLNAYGSVCVGLPTLSCGVNPSLVLDRVALVNKLSGSRLFFGCNMLPSISSATAATLVLTNGSRLVADTVMVNYAGGASASGVSVAVEADASEFVATYLLNAGYGASTCNVRYTFKNASRLLVNSCTLNAAPIVFDFDASVFAKNAAADPVALKCCEMPQTFFFRNGSDFRCSSLEAATAGKILSSCYSLTFGDSTWTPGTGDFTFEFPTVTNVQIVAEGRGLVLAPPADRTWDFRLPVSGTGGMVAAGAGTVRFDGPKWGASGAFAIEEGATLDLAASCATGLVVSGAGKLANAHLVRGGLASALADDGSVTAALPVFDGVTFDGSFSVNAGRSGGTPLASPYRTVAVARYAGDAPDVSRWRLRGAGGVGARFVAQDGTVWMTPEKRGLLLIMR